jgi:predicted  nucleic acid-binding Zn-ribbon protein
VLFRSLETAQATLAGLDKELEGFDARIAELAESKAARATELETTLADVLAERPGAVEGLPDDLLALYDKLRESKGGIGAAELRARQCGGCRLTLDAAELTRIRSLPSTEVVRCEECGRILVRTAESGL